MQWMSRSWLAFKGIAMKRINLDKKSLAVREFLASLSIGVDGVELEMNGRVIGKLFPPLAFSEAEKKALIQQRWQLIHQAQKRNRGVPSRVIEREVREAVEAVRRGQQ